MELSSNKIDFFDITLDLQNNIYNSFRKENAKEVYINSNPNHPPNIKRELPRMIQHRLSHLSKNKHVFDEHKTPYQTALTNSAFKTSLEFTPITTKTNKRKKQVFYFNPPYNSSLKTNIGKKFLKLVDKHFHKTGVLKKIQNRNTIKISYSYMPNLRVGLRIAQRHFCTGVTLARIDTLAKSDTLARTDALARRVTFARLQI